MNGSGAIHRASEIHGAAALGWPARLSVAYGLNSAWMLSCRAEARAFTQATFRVAETQQTVLRRIIASNRATHFGEAHDFASVADPASFQRAVPLAAHDAFAPLVERIAMGEGRLLTSERVTLLEPTSGTTRGEKLVPYTASLRREFQRALAVWIEDLFRRRPAVRAGRAFWSVSPAWGPARNSPGGVPIGFDDDTAYLARWQRPLVRRLLAVPPEVARVHEIDAFRYATLLALLRADDLALISVWSPTFLTALFFGVDRGRERLIDDLKSGRVTPPLTQSAASHPPAAPNPRAAELLATGRAMSELSSELWPRLALVSCWTDGAAAAYLPGMRSLLPGVEIQPKGLLATEAFVSIPLVDQSGAALAIRSHFFEFEPVDGGGPARLAHEVDLGARYTVVVTTGGGLYRYRLGDVVEIVGRAGNCPLLRFVGRAGVASDLAGEKLDEPFVASAISRVLAEVGGETRFAALVPLASHPADVKGAAPAGPGYRLYLEGRPRGVSFDPAAFARAVAATLERRLEENPHYRYAVSLGQLAPLEVALLAEGSRAWEICERLLSQEGRKLGDIKPPALLLAPACRELLAALPTSARVQGNPAAAAR